MARQVPHGAEDMDCPLHKKPMSKVCHKCPWWTQLKGKDPQSSAEIDRWDCAIAVLPILNVAVAQQVHQVDGTMQSFRNEVAKNGVVVAPDYKTMFQPDRPVALPQAETKMIEAG